MDFEKSACLEKIYREVDITPEEYLPALLEIVKGFRIGVLKPADESFRQGMQDVMENRTRPISELWEGIDA
ncbi:MAG: hypothetical protein LC660_08320 [Desulfobacteraceae bacterium]|nr:hypothetical protein [Desulfobacteraceae bacterium]